MMALRQEIALLLEKEAINEVLRPTARVLFDLLPGRTAGFAPSSTSELNQFIKVLYFCILRTSGVLQVVLR